MTTPHRDLALVDPWQRSLERSLHRRAIAPGVRRSLARRRRASVALTSLMAFGPTGGLLAAAGFGFGARADVAQASPANRAIDSGATPGAMALQLGSRGDAVAEIQRELGVPVDAVFGPVTHGAVVDFQARNGLDVDGVVGPVTWTALFGLERAAAAAGAGDGEVAVIVRPRGDEGSAGTDEGGSTPADEDVLRTRPVSNPAPLGDEACGRLRLASPVKGTVTSGFGPRWGRNHDGLDIAAPTGTAIRAVECGVVSFSGVQGGYGNMVCIKHSSRFETCYAHMSRIAAANGQAVRKGQVIGHVGCTGSCTGPHLHFETRVDGAARDPRPYLGGAGVPGSPSVKAATSSRTTTQASFSRRTGGKPRATTAHEDGWSAATGGASAPAPQPVATTAPQPAPATAPAPTEAPATTPAPTAPVPTPTPQAPPAPAPEADPAPTYPPPATPVPGAPTTAPAAAPDATIAPPVEPPPVEPSPVEPSPVEPSPVEPPPVEPIRRP